MQPQNAQQTSSVLMTNQLRNVSIDNNDAQQNNNNKNNVQNDPPAIYGEWKSVLPTPQNSNPSDSNNMSAVIFNRVNHCSFSYKNNIYFYGGQQDTSNKGPALNVQPISEEQNGQLNQNLYNTPLNSQTQVSAQGRKQSLWNSLHKLNPSTKQFSKQPLNITSNIPQFMNISSFGYFVYSNTLFVFGGINYQTKIPRNSEMFSINIESGTIKRYESKTSTSSIPSLRLNPLITAIQKNILLLFGGEVYNHSLAKYEYLNDMYTFKIETKTWTRIQDSFHAKFPILIRPTLLHFGDNCIYLLGGKREILNNDGSEPKQIDNNQIYRLKIITKTVSSKADCIIKQVFATNPIPIKQSFVKILKYLQKGIIAVTTDLHQPGKNTYFWYYDHSNVIWTEIKQNNQNIKSSIFCGRKEQFLIGYQRIFTMQNNLQILQLNFNQIALEATIKSNAAYQKPLLCSICKQQSQLHVQAKNIISAQRFEQICSPIDFPFAAIGLLIDNTLITNAKNCNIHINVAPLGKQAGNQNNKVKYLIVQDNGVPTTVWSPELKNTDFLSTIMNFYSTTLPEDTMAAEDNKKMIARNLKQIDQKQRNLQRQFAQFQKNQSKQNGTSNTSNFAIPNVHFKTQKDFQKQQHVYIQKKQRLQHKKRMIQSQQKCRLFCNNLKIAGVSLGDTIIYACKQKKGQQGVEFTAIDKDIRRFFFMRKQRDNNLNKVIYVCYGYVTQNGNAADPKMEGTIKHVAKQFKKQLKFITEKLKSVNNIVLITDLKNISNYEENLSSDKNIQPLPISTNISQLRLKKKINDVFYGDPNILNYLENNNIARASQICDISLKTYLSMLYLGKQEPVMYMSIKQNQLEFINTQPFLPSIDKLLSSKKIIQISKSLDFSDECSVVEVYWNPQYLANNQTIGTKINSLGYLLNGVLIYFKSRLVTRYGIQLGKLLQNLEIDPRYGSIFGYLQTKPQYGTNLYQTDLFYPRAFQKYYARLHFVNEVMQNKYRDKKSRGRDDQYMGTYQRISKKSKQQ